MATGSFARSDFRNVEMEVVIRQRIRRPWRVRKGGPFGPQQRKPNKLDAAYTVCRDASGEAANLATLPGRRWQPTRTSVLRFARTVNPCSARRPGLGDHPGAAGVFHLDLHEDCHSAPVPSHGRLAATLTKIPNAETQCATP